MWRWLRPVTYRAICDLTQLITKRYRQKSVVLLLWPGAAVLAQLAPKSVLRAIGTVTVCRTPRYVRFQIAPDLGRELFSRVLRIDCFPARRPEHKKHSEGKGEKRSQKNDQQARGKRLLVRNVGHIEYFHRRNLFHFLYFRHFILFSKSFKNRFLNLRSSVQIRIRDTEQGQSSDRGIH